jgi:type VI secretion system protein ImpB
MATEIQHEISRVRPPRVQITYDVEIGNAIEVKELPFVVGVVADLSGLRDPNRVMPPVKDRKFAEIDRDNFNSIMNEIAPRVAFQVPNNLNPKAAASELEVLLTFKSMDDFGPLSIISQIAPLNALYQSRQRLKDLTSKLDGNDALEALLTNLLTNKATQTELQNNINQAKPAAPSAPATPAK